VWSYGEAAQKTLDRLGRGFPLACSPRTDPMQRLGPSECGDHLSWQSPVSERISSAVKSPPQHHGGVKSWKTQPVCEHV